MTTIGEQISKLKVKLISMGYEDDHVLSSDELLYGLLNDAGAIVYKRVKDKFMKVPDFMFTRYGVRLTEANEDVYSCEDIPDRCKILESDFELPLSLYGRNKNSLKVYSGHQELPLYNPSNQYDPYLSSLPSYKIQNGKLRVYNNKILKAVDVEAVWHDPIKWLPYKYCQDTDTVECYDLNEIAYPLYSNPEYVSMAHDIILQSLQLTIQNTLSNQNDAH